MALPVIAGIFRVTLNWSTQSGVSPKNVLHVNAGASDVEAVAAAFDDALTAGHTGDNMWKPMFSGFTTDSISIIPLDGISPASDHTVAEVGGGTGGDWTPAIAAVVSLKTGQKGPRGRGRCYVGPLAETTFDVGLLNTSPQTEMLNGWQAFITNLSDVGGMDLVIASYAHRDFHNVVSHRIDNMLGTMRRRQDQLR